VVEECGVVKDSKKAGEYVVVALVEKRQLLS
jgi:hypothetical protein